MKYADMYAQSKGYLNANKMINILNSSNSESPGDAIMGMIQGEIINALRSIDNKTHSNDEASK